MEDTDYDKCIRTRIIGTIGPSCNNKEKIIDLMDEGMNIFRVQIYHYTVEENLKLVKMMNEAFEERPGKTCAIMVDTGGRQIRLLDF